MTDKTFAAVAGYVYAKDASIRDLKASKRERQDLFAEHQEPRSVEVKRHISYLDGRINALENVLSWLTIGEGE